MSTAIAPTDQAAEPRTDRSGRPRVERWGLHPTERRRLRRQDVLSSRLAELHAIRTLLDRASEVVEHGWIQGAWYAVATAGGRRAVTAPDLGLVTTRPVTDACLVGAVVQAAGGPATVRSQLVQRTLDLTWHTLREDPERPVRWCPGPQARMLQVRDLTSWNDARGRTAGEVVELLAAARDTADRQRVMVRAGGPACA